MKNASSNKTRMISLQNVSLNYGKSIALDHFSCDFPIGKVTGIIGPNGSGKTSAINCLMGLQRPKEGTISFPEALKNAPIGFCLEQVALHNSLSAVANLKRVASLRGIDDPHEIDRWVDSLDVSSYAKKHLSKLSMGQRQRVKIAATLIGLPEIIIFDEPHNGLDPIGFRDFRNLVMELKTRETTVLIASHLLDEVRKMCDNVVLIKNGRMIHQLDLQNEPASDLELYFT